MSKNKGKNWNSKPPPSAPAKLQGNPPSSPKPPSPIDYAEKQAASAGAKGVVIPPSTASPFADEFQQAKARLEEIIRSYEEARNSLEKDKESLKSEKDAFNARLLKDRQAFEEERRKRADEEKEASLKRQAEEESREETRREVQDEREKFKLWKQKTEEQIQKDRADLQTEKQALDQRRQGVAKREEEIQKREADADAGFLQRQEEALRKMRAAHQDLLAKYESLQKDAVEREKKHLETLDKQRSEFFKEIDKRRSDWETEREAQRQKDGEGLEKERQKLRKQEEGLQAQVRQAEHREREAQWREKSAEEKERDLGELIEEETEKRSALKNDEIQRLEERLEDARTQIEKTEKRLEEKEAAFAKLGESEPEEIQRKIDRLEETIRGLRAELAERPSRAEYEAVKEKSERLSDCEEALWRKGETIRELERKLEGWQVEVTAVEALRDQKRAMEGSHRLLQATLESLRKEIEGYTQKLDDKPIFAELVRMDQDADLQEKQQLWPFLKKHVNEGESPYQAMGLALQASKMQQHLANDPRNKRPPLYYREKDIRAFLGGMAMSRLLLLQGISGIGKSSLPRALGPVFGGECEDISVQAGWRDKNDLFGYFNSFERKYYESALVQALYRAQTEKWEERVIFVLLDEMNLSHPEQYAADILDVLERQDQEKKRFELISFSVQGQAPRKLQNGRYLRLPENVWFVGTANHDETTKDFADKTYDRSFVMELPSQPEAFEPKETKAEKHPVRVSSLLEAFRVAQEKQAGEATKAKEWLNQEMRGLLAEKFEIGWGGRLEGQMEKFLPVVIEAGGTLGEGLDHLLSMRLLRKLRGRHDNRVGDLEEIRSVLEHAWLDETARPEASIELLEREIRRLGR